MADALYVRRSDDTYEPAELTLGPWQGGTQHGGPVAALLAGLADSVPAELSMRVARLTIELLRPVPIALLTSATEVVRQGRKVQLVAAELRSDGTPVARARGLRIREGAVTLPPRKVDPPPPGPHGARPPARIPAGGYVQDAVDIRFVRSDFNLPGPGTAWVRLRVPVVADEEPSPLQRAAAAADFGNGISAQVPLRTHVYINPDLTVYLHRPPAGEWIGLESASYLEPDGVGLADTALFDVTGRVGRAAQSLYVADR